MKLPNAFADGEEAVNVIIETPYGSRNKFAWDPELGLFRLKKILPFGTEFPLDMGFIPNTKGGDGDPLDVLVMMEKPAFPGCLVECRLLGVIEALQQKKKEKAQRNDRLLAIPMESRDYSKVRSIRDLDKDLVDDIVRFFAFYNDAEGTKFSLLDIRGPQHAHKLVKKHQA